MAKPATALSDFDRPSVTVDLVLLTVADGALSVLVIRRDEPPSAGDWALPGGFVHIDKSIEETVQRVLRDKARLPGAFVEQLYTFGAVGRDPRGRVISVAHYALVAHERLASALTASGDLALAEVITRRSGEEGGTATIRLETGETPLLPFDHSEVLGLAVRRLRGKLDYTAVGLELLPDRFPLRALQVVHEAILGHPLTKPAFRRKMLDRGYLEPTGEREAAGAFRPAELYRRADPKSFERKDDHG
jgi:8-oxo-dGTP diphosphatase